MAAIADSETDLHPAGQNGAVNDGSTHANTTRIVVPVDGSPFAERAPARGCVALAAVGVSMHLVEVVRPDDDVERAGR